MGTWDIGSFDNDAAADFAGRLDKARAEEREGIVRAALARAAEADDVEADDGSEAVAAATLVAAQCPGGKPVTTAYGPREALPAFPADLAPLAVRALDRVLANSELAVLWDDAGHGPLWRQGVGDLREVLAQST
ncbi:DUF4259 domain-containing protein [Nocardia sp. NRRL S-836]|uniref:DUF4259 domain-containing protein n=1 Tax=Nocardia sp. NRRL S-836 TaxID=1519492 RepID=UPI0006AE1263|nr:DUF4259 domain-containing protein [Nocardia sp. NRRL S-836]KOV89041.1 hypothetical protein ADL03_03610 [Nocardia sp. NRRL S-836]